MRGGIFAGLTLGDEYWRPCSVFHKFHSSMASNFTTAPIVTAMMLPSIRSTLLNVIILKRVWKRMSTLILWLPTVLSLYGTCLPYRLEHCCNQSRLENNSVAIQ